jgi:DNA-binding transcriptional ArsR family regulator
MSEPLDLIFTALANPTRRAMLDRLTAGEATVNDLAAPFALSQPTISSHIKVLEAAGLVTRGRAANMRPVRLDPAALAQAHLWIGRYQQLWTERLATLETYAKSLEHQEKDDARNPKQD